MGRGRPWSGRDVRLEKHATASEGVDVRTHSSRPIPIAVEAVRPERVEGDENNVHPSSTPARRKNETEERQMHSE
jgi:hypothetical protein